MINFGNIKSYPTFSSYQRLKTIKSKELTERKNLKKGTIKSYKDYLDKKNGFKCCNGIHEQCCYCLTGKNALNENCLDVSSKYNCFPCPKWRNVLRVANNFVSIHVSNKGKHIIAAEDGEDIYISNDFGNNWTQSQPSSASKNWKDVILSSTGTYYFVEGEGKIFESTDGKTWEKIYESDAIKVESLALSLDGKKEYFIASNGIYNEFKIATTTKTQSMSDKIKVISTDETGENVVAITSNEIHVSLDSGTKWIDISGGKNGSLNDAVISGEGNQILVTDSSNDAIWISRRIDKDISENAQFESISKIKNNGISFNYNWKLIKSSENGSYIVASTTDGQVWLSSDYGNSWDNIKTFAGVIKDISIGIDDTNNKLRLVVAENKNLWSYTINI